jgi:hypothetical protein
MLERTSVVVPSASALGSRRVSGRIRVVDAHLVESGLLVALEPTEETRRRLARRPEIEDQGEEVGIEDESDDPLLKDEAERGPSPVSVCQEEGQPAQEAQGR